jgi:hypothetical protein
MTFDDWNNILSVNAGQHTLSDVVPVRVSARRILRTVYGSKGKDITGGSNKPRNEELHNL